MLTAQTSQCDTALSQRVRTALKVAIGPVTAASVDAAIRVAYQTQRPVMLIFSRSQLECSEMGSGYVNHWSTEELAGHVRRHDPLGLVVLCRDHGGPWQHPGDASHSEAGAMRRSLFSFEVDLASGFELLHIDTSSGSDGPASPAEALSRFMRIYEALANKRDPSTFAVEVGFEDQSSEIHDPAELKRSLSSIVEECTKSGLPLPIFVVAQTGTKICGRSNVGRIRVESQDQLDHLSQLRVLSEIAGEYDIALKAHNCDYLTQREWSILSFGAVTATNIAPELGTKHSLRLLDLWTRSGMHDAADRYVAIARDSGKWRKWVADPRPCDRELGILAGHYIMSSPEVRSSIDQLSDRLAIEGIDLDRLLVNELADHIMSVNEVFESCATQPLQRR